MFLVALTVVLFVILGNKYGIGGMVIAFVIPLTLDMLITLWIPLTIKKPDDKVK
jgi:hypothetical protein